MNLPSRKLWNGITAIDLFIRNLSLDMSLKSVQRAVSRMPIVSLQLSVRLLKHFTLSFSI